jgi:hypothetical protein
MEIDDEIAGAVSAGSVPADRLTPDGRDTISLDAA